MKVVCIENLTSVNAYNFIKGNIYIVVYQSEEDMLFVLEDEISLPGNSHNSLLLDGVSFFKHFIDMMQRHKA